MKATKAWAVVKKDTGRISAWWPRTGEGEDDYQFDVFVRRKDAIRTRDEWTKNDSPHQIVRVEIREIAP